MSLLKRAINNYIDLHVLDNTLVRVKGSYNFIARIIFYFICSICVKLKQRHFQTKTSLCFQEKII